MSVTHTHTNVRLEWSPVEPLSDAIEKSIRKRGIATVSMISADTGRSRATVDDVLAALCSRGTVERCRTLLNKRMTHIYRLTKRKGK